MSEVKYGVCWPYLPRYGVGVVGGKWRECRSLACRWVASVPAVKSTYHAWHAVPLDEAGGAG